MSKFNRKCPECHKVVAHTTKYQRDTAVSKGLSCKRCAAIKNLGKFTEKGYGAGDRNPFFGKRHTEETKLRMKTMDKDKSFFKTKSYKNKISKLSRGENNGMYGKTYYQIWVEKYGKEVADKKQKEKNEKTSLRVSGTGNPMYGKPAPQGAGNGWKGWYKGWFFRSLKELSYVLNVLEPQNISWESAESLGIKIPYTAHDGLTRNYTPDFLINGKKLVEIKPQRLRNSLSVRVKEDAALKYAKENNLEYEIIDPIDIQHQVVRKLHENGEITFMKQYEKKFKLYIDTTMAFATPTILRTERVLIAGQV
jgi:hypothetical protein